MDFLSSPVHNYSYETFDDAFFELPKEMDFDLTEEFRDNMSCNIDEDDDLNDGMYGVWNVKHPWSVNNNSSSHYNSNLHLDFIGGDPESAIMVNPHVVIPNGFEFDKEREKLEDTSQYHLKENISLDVEAIENSSSVKLELPESAKETESNTVRIKNLKNTFLSLKENITNEDYNKTNLPKNGIRVLKPAVVESSLPALSSMIGNNQTKSENINNRLKHSLSKNINNSKCNYYYPNDTFYPKPAFSYSCLIAMALKNSKHGCLPVAFAQRKTLAPI